MTRLGIFTIDANKIIRITQVCKACLQAISSLYLLKKARKPNNAIAPLNGYYHRTGFCLSISG
jgi:hypothetical protein